MADNDKDGNGNNKDGDGVHGTEVTMVAGVGVISAMVILMVTMAGMVTVTGMVMVSVARWLSSNCSSSVGGGSSCGDGGHGGGGAVVHKAWDPPVTGAAPFVSINFILDDTGKSRHKLRVLAWSRRREEGANVFDFDECFQNKAGRARTAASS